MYFMLNLFVECVKQIVHKRQRASFIALLLIRDVTKFEFKFNNVRTSNIFNRLKIWQIFLALCCRMRICGNFLFYDRLHMHREPESADKPVFPKFNLSHKLQLLNVQHNFCSVTCSIDLNQCITFRLIKQMPLFAFNKFRPASTHQ